MHMYVIDWYAERKPCAAEDVSVKNENDAVIVWSELLKVFLEEGKFFISLLENFTWFTVKTQLDQSDQR